MDRSAVLAPHPVVLHGDLSPFLKLCLGGSAQRSFGGFFFWVMISLVYSAVTGMPQLRAYKLLRLTLI